MTRKGGDALPPLGPVGVVAVLLGCTALGVVLPLRPPSAAAAGTTAVTATAAATGTGTATATAAAPTTTSATGTATGTATSTATATATAQPTDAVPTPTPTGSAGPTAAPTPAPSTAPPATPTDPGAAATGSAPPPSPNLSPNPSPGPSVSGTAGAAPPEGDTAGGPPVVVEHVVLAVVDGPAAPPRYLELDAAAPGVRPYTTLRVRFGLRNTSATAQDVIPRLEYRLGGDGAFVPVPVPPTPGAPFHLGHEWVRPDRAEGTQPGPDTEAIPVNDFRAVGQVPAATRVEGRHVTAANPDAGVSLPPGAATEEEFTVRAGIDILGGRRYEFRLTDGGAALTPPATPPAAAAGVPAGTAVVEAAAAAPPALSPGQRQGASVGAPRQPTAGAAGVRYVLAAAPGPAAVAVTGAATGTAAAAAGAEGIHGPYRLTGDQCASCHSTHTGRGPNLLNRAGPQSTLCFTCHDGTGAPQDVKAQYSTSVPANDLASGTYHSHDALAPSTHTSSGEDEFGGVSNRHSGCSDCHNSHRATDRPAEQTAAGWTASGRLAGTSGVAVTNGAAGSAPAYTFLDGTSAPITLEYQLCFKCHSGFTVLPSNAGLLPSRYLLDKGVELNPDNPSYHPVEAAGTNQTPAMADSLTGTSPYKLWNFTTGSTIRCTNCHAGEGAVAGTPGADADLSPHTSPNAGILLRPYRDQQLKAAGEKYAAADFALCFSCHGEAPFTGSSRTATNFPHHGMHVSGLEDEGNGGTSIDVPGAGSGNALCAECHFRLHGTPVGTGGQSVPGSRLVNFAPDVTPNNGVISWTPSGTGGSCTLTCHGERHDNFRY